MGLIKEEQKTILTLRLEDNSVRELECFIKEIDKDRLSLTLSEDSTDNANYFEEGSEIAVTVITSTGLNRFDSIVLDSPFESSIVIDYNGEYTEIDRREFPRCKLETKFIIERLMGQNIITTTTDLGGGGLKFIYDGEFRVNEWVNSRIYTELNSPSVRAAGTILKKSHLLENEYLILFNQVNELDREVIVGKCLDVQKHGVEGALIE